MNVNDCYRELGLTAGCSDAEIKAAWRRLAAHWHPDRNGSPHALRKIQRINRALEEIRRSRGANGGREAAAASADPATRGDEAHDAQRSEVLRTVEHTVELSLEEAAAGCVRELQGELVDACAACAGTGQQLQPSSCPACDGAGRVRQPLWFGWVAPLGTCGACAGEGSTRPRCAACAGSGRGPVRSYRCRLRIPPGVRQGHRVEATTRLQGRSASEAIGLSVRIAWKPHPLFAVDADGTVRCEVPVDGFAWMANRWTEVPTPHGLRQMKLRRDYLVYRVKGGGLPGEPSATCADCIVSVVPLFPETLSAAQEAGIDRLIAGNSGAARTAAGKRMSEWQERVGQWQQGLRAGGQKRHRA